MAGYLGLRLPAEITIPHSDYPQPTIFRPPSSYLGKKVPFPAASHSSNTSPEGSRTLETQIQLPKPRTLFLDRALTHLAAQDAPAYSLFIEGVSLLAYNIAWLCRTQGLKDFNTLEDICPMGHNLYRLLIAQETRVPIRPENPLDKDILPPKSGSKSLSSRGPAAFGELSHATSHSFIGSAENVQYLSGWRLTPTKITDDLRAYLLAEQQAQEWDMLNAKELEDMENLIAEDPVLVGEKRRDTVGSDVGRSYLTTTTAGNKASSPAGDETEAGKAEERKKGVSGWTKLKSRSEE